MSFFEAVTSCFDKYFDGSGRAMRSEYWWWTVFTILVNIVCSIADAIIGAGQLVATLASIALFLPGITATVRRLHDIGKSGHVLLFLYAAALPLVILTFGLAVTGSIALVLPLVVLLALAGYYFFLMVKPSDHGPNQYGAQP